MPSYLITGGSRGLGLGYVTELLKEKANTVIATARNTATSSGLQLLKSKDNQGQLFLVDLDVSKLESIRAAVKKTAELVPSGLDNLISNAGVSLNASTTFEDLDVEELMSEINFTVTAPLLLVREFLPIIKKSEQKRILVLTSALGSLQQAAYMPNLANAYSVSRATLNMLVRKWSPVLKAEGITIAMIHPGWVGATDIGDGISDWITKNNPGLPNLTIEHSANDVMKVLNGLTLEDAGAFYNHDGTTIPF